MILKKGTVSKEVAAWQKFLGLPADGIFGDDTELATKRWQKDHGLTPDGEVGPKTKTAAGFPVDLDAPGRYYPPKPLFTSPSSATREKLFGKFKWKKKNSTDIQILGDWTKENIVKVQIPQLVGVEGAPKDGTIYFHKKGAAQIKGFFAEVERQGLLHLVISWAGSFYPRFIRGSKSSLSNHSWGTAFDINAPQNWLGAKPAAVGQKGSLLKLVPIANSFGFFWGGHYNSRLDGMHFELSVLDLFPEKILTPEPQVTDPEQPSQSEPSESEPDVQVSDESSMPTIGQMIARTKEISGQIKEGAVAIKEIKEVLPAMRPDHPATKVTSGKKTSFGVNIFGLIMSLGTAAFGFFKENLMMILIGFVGLILIGITIAVTFTVINALKMKYTADPTKFNVE